MRFGEWEPIKNTSIPALTPAPALTPTLSQKAAMPDAETSKPKKAMERKKHPWIINVLKEFAGAMTIIKRIFDLRINLTVGKLLASAPVVENQLTKAITEDEAVQFPVNTLKSNTVNA